MQQHKKLTAAWVLMAVWLFGAWTVCELCLMPLLEQTITNRYLYYLLRDVLAKNIIWTLPASLLIRHFSSELAIPCRELFSLRKEHLRYLLIGVFLAVFVLTGAWVRRHGFSLSPDFHPAQWIIVLVVGFTEEIVFRGFFLNASLIGADSNIKKGTAVGINALMFLAIHFPVWIRQGVFLANFAGFGFLTILALSVLFSYCTIRCRSLWTAILLHSFYDALVFLLV